jgi:hypothetical protein
MCINILQEDAQFNEGNNVKPNSYDQPI